MFDFVANIWQDAHSIIVHFPISLLVVSFGLSLAALVKPTWLQAAWLTFVIHNRTLIWGEKVISANAYQKPGFLSFAGILR